MLHAQTIDSKSSDLIIRHIDLLERMGWLEESENILTQYGSSVLEEHEYNLRLARIREKRRIYEKTSPGPADGRSYIGRDDVVRLVKGPVTMTYHLKDTGIDITAVYRTMVWIMDLVREHLDYSPRQVQVSLHHDHSLPGSPPDDNNDTQVRVAGSFHGCIHLRSSMFHDAEPQRLCVFLAHEYVHQAVCDLSGNRAPRWLDEGLAVHLSQNLSIQYTKALNQALDQDSVFPLETLESPALFKTKGLPGILACAQACSLAHFLMERLGREGMQRLLKSMGRISAENALKQFSLNYYLLEREWKRWALSRR